MNFGIIGAGNIAHRFAASLKKHPNGRLTAISCRNGEKGKAFAGKYGVNSVYIGHGNLLEDPDIDAVYIALPHEMHKEWAIRAMEKGKAVLCEKPASISGDDTAEMIEAARKRQVLFMEAMKPRFVPLYRKLRDLIRGGTLGEVHSIRVCLCRRFVFDPEKPTYHTDPVQGGCLLDMGIYGISLLEEFLGPLVRVEEAGGIFSNGVEFHVTAKLWFPGYRTATIECAFDRDKEEEAVIVGERGEVHIERPVRPEKMVVIEEGKEETVEIPYEVDDFYGEIDHFIQCFEANQTESPIMPLEASLHCAQMVDAIKQAMQEPTPTA